MAITGKSRVSAFAIERVPKVNTKHTINDTTAIFLFIVHLLIGHYTNRNYMKKSIL
jgi:hypothetical protein